MTAFILSPTAELIVAPETMWAAKPEILLSGPVQESLQIHVLEYFYNTNMPPRPWIPLEHPQGRIS